MPDAPTPDPLAEPSTDHETLEATPDDDRQRTPYQPDDVSMKVLLGALVLGAAVGIGVLVLILLV